MKLEYPSGGVIIRPFKDLRKHIVHIFTKDYEQKIDANIIDKICTSPNPKAIGLTNHFDPHENKHYSIYFGDKGSICIPSTDDDLLSSCMRNFNNRTLNYFETYELNVGQHNKSVYSLVHFKRDMLYYTDDTISDDERRVPFMGVEMYKNDVFTLHIIDLILCRRFIAPKV